MKISQLCMVELWFECFEYYPYIQMWQYILTCGVRATCDYGKVKSRSGHDVAYLHRVTNVPTQYQLPTPYGCRDITRTRFYRSRSLQQGHIMTLHT